MRPKMSPLYTCNSYKSSTLCEMQITCIKNIPYTLASHNIITYYYSGHNYQLEYNNYCADSHTDCYISIGACENNINCNYYNKQSQDRKTGAININSG